MKDHTGEGQPSGTVRTKEPSYGYGINEGTDRGVGEGKIERQITTYKHQLLDLPHNEWTKDQTLKHAVWGCFEIWRRLSDEDCSQSRRRELFAHYIKWYADQKNSELLKELEVEKARHKDLNGALRFADDERVELRKELSDTKANLGRAYDGVNYWKPLAEKQQVELTTVRSLLDRMAEAGNELTHLHACEQEGLASGKPTFKQWVEAVDKLNTVLTEYQSMKQ